MNIVNPQTTGRLFVLWLLTALFCRAQDPVQRWFPLNNGDHRTYGILSEELVHTVRSLGVVDGLSYYELNDEGALATFVVDGGVLKLRFLEGLGETIGFSPPLSLFNETTVVNGGSLTTAAQISIRGSVVAGASATLKSTVSLAGQVTVPAGTYKDCRQLSWTITVTGAGGTGGLSSQLLTLAPGVGPVREALLDENNRFVAWWELVSGTVGGVDVKEIAKQVAPVVTKHPASLTSVGGQTASFVVTASGIPAPTYRWQRKPAGVTTWSDLADGGSYGGTGTATLMVNPTATSMSGDQYRCVASNLLGSVNSNPATLTVTAPPTPPAITAAPTNQTIAVGASTTFKVVAVGTAPLAYQWKRSGTNLPNGGGLSGVTTATLTLTAAQASHAGEYSVTVTNSAGSATSTPATLAVLIPPTIFAPPTNRIVAQGSTVSLTVTAAGSAPFGYRWRKGTTPLTETGNFSGTDTATLTIANIQTSDAGGYNVVVTNRVGTVTSATATVTVELAPVITAPPTNLVVAANANATFKVTATGSPTLTYQWRHAGTNLPNGGGFSGVNTATLAVVGAKTNHVGTYSVVVSNRVGTTASADVVLTVLPLQPQIVKQPESLRVHRTNGPATTASFSVEAIGVGPLTYQWRRNGTNLAAQTTSTLVLTDVRRLDAAEYSVRVSNASGSVISSNATLRVTAPLRLRHASLLTNGVVRLSIGDEEGPPYQAVTAPLVAIEATTNLTTRAWRELYRGSALPVVGGGLQFEDAQANAETTRFYRVFEP